MNVAAPSRPWHLPGRALPEALLAAASAAPEGAELLKESPVRLLCRVRWKEESAVVKINRCAGLLDRLARLAGLDPARREAHALAMARAAGLPVPEPLAWRAGPGNEVRLLLADLGPGTPLVEALDQGSPLLPEALGSLLARIHQAGLLHHDLHAGNLLVGPDGSLRLLDLQSARLRSRALNWPERRRGLVFLWLSLRPRCGVRPALHALRAYRAKADFPPGPCRHLAFWARRIDQEADRLRERLWHKREDRPFRDCSDFRRIQEPGRVRILARAPRADSVPSSLAGIEAAGLNTLRQGRRGWVVRGPGWYAKERDRRHACGLWLAHERLKQRGIPAPPPLALILEGTRGAVVTGDVGPLPDLCAALAGAGPERIDAVLEGAARLAARLHRTGLRNRDLKAANLLVSDGPGGLELVTVDLDGLHRPRRLRLGHAARDLARLAASLAALGASPAGLLARYQALPGLPRSWVPRLRRRFEAGLRRLGSRL